MAGVSAVVALALIFPDRGETVPPLFQKVCWVYFVVCWVSRAGCWVLTVLYAAVCFVVDGGHGRGALYLF